MKFFLSIFSALIFSLTGIAQESPAFQIQSKESLYKYLADKNISFDKNDVAVLKDIKVFAAYNTNGMLTVPEAYFFNNKGHKVNGFKGAACAQAIQKLEKINKKSADEKDTIGKWTNRFMFLESDNENDFRKVDYDFYVIINWATFLPEENEISFNWYQSLKDNKQYKIKVILLSLDIYDSWELDADQKKALKL